MTGRQLRRLAADHKALEDQPAPSLVLLALALERAGDMDRAEQVLRRAWRQAPATSGSTSSSGTVHANRYGFVQAGRSRPIPLSRRRDPPAERGLQPHLGIALRDQGKLDEAIAEYRERCGLSPISRGPLQPRQRPQGPREAGGGDRRIPRSAAAQARLSRGPL